MIEPVSQVARHPCEPVGGGLSASCPVSQGDLSVEWPVNPFTVLKRLKEADGQLHGFQGPGGAAGSFQSTVAWFPWALWSVWVVLIDS